MELMKLLEAMFQGIQELILQTLVSNQLNLEQFQSIQLVFYNPSNLVNKQDLSQLHSVPLNYYTRTFYFSVRVYVYAYYVEFTFSNHALLPIIFLRVCIKLNF